MSNLNELMKRRHAHISPSLSLSYDEPLHIIKGKKQYLFDSKGIKYLDAVNNIQHIGHCHPKVTEAAINQYKKLNTNTRYLDHVILDYAEELTSKFSEDLNTCFFTNSGSESNDLALRLAREFTDSQETIVLDGAYHGHLISLIEISPYKYNGSGGKGSSDYVHSVFRPDSFRGKYRGKDSSAKYIHDLRKKLSLIRARDNGIPTFIAESIMGCGGQIIPPENFLKNAYELIKIDNGICIADEIQVGFGRTGSHFWGYETENLCPDIVTIGKSMGNGHPISAVITTKDIANKFNNGMEYFNSFGGNPVSCAIGHAVLKVIDQEELQKNANDVGQKLESMLINLKDRHSIVGDIRGKGLFWGIEFVKKGKELLPAPIRTKKIVNQMKEKQILLSSDGPDHNVIKIKPPMVFSQKNAERLVETLDSVLSNI